MRLNCFSQTLVHRALAIVLMGGLASVLLSACGPASAERKETTKEATKPAAQPATGMEVATFGAGCFWSVEAMFKQLKGVTSAEPGYAGGKQANPSYEEVCSGNTGHAEAVNIIFDPKVISYRDLAEIFLTVHDPTTLNRQGADEGTQYRSAIFYRSEAQKRDAEEIIKKVTAARLWNDPIVTQVAPYKQFYRAEDYHLNYYERHPKQPYCVNVITPKIEKFRAKFKDKLK
jgi:peptide-methionine (S)-S-oxide reductase